MPSSTPRPRPHPLALPPLSSPPAPPSRTPSSAPPAPGRDPPPLLARLRAQSRAVGEKLYHQGPGRRRHRPPDAASTPGDRKKMRKNMSAYVSRFAAKKYEELLAEAVGSAEADIARTRAQAASAQSENRRMRAEVSRLERLVHGGPRSAPVGFARPGGALIAAAEAASAAERGRAAAAAAAARHRGTSVVADVFGARARIRRRPSVSFARPDGDRDADEPPVQRPRLLSDLSQRRPVAIAPAALPPRPREGGAKVVAAARLGETPTDTWVMAHASARPASVKADGDVESAA